MGYNEFYLLALIGNHLTLSTASLGKTVRLFGLMKFKFKSRIVLSYRFKQDFGKLLNTISMNGVVVVFIMSIL